MKKLSVLGIIGGAALLTAAPFLLRLWVVLRRLRLIRPTLPRLTIPALLSASGGVTRVEGRASASHEPTRQLNNAATSSTGT